MTKPIYFIAGILFAAPSFFFVYYTVRLAYINLTMTADEAAVHRTGGMLIGAIAFPLAAIISGVISWFCLSRGLKDTK
jgi:hypothetical protein